MPLTLLRLVAGSAALLLAGASWGTDRWTDDSVVVLAGFAFHPELDTTKLIIAACLFYLGFAELQARRLASGACCLAAAYLFQPLWPHLQRLPVKTWSRIDLLTGIVMIAWSSRDLNLSQLRKVLGRPLIALPRFHLYSILVVCALGIVLWARDQQRAIEVDRDSPYTALGPGWMANWTYTLSTVEPPTWKLYSHPDGGFQAYFPSTPSSGGEPDKTTMTCIDSTGVEFCILRDKTDDASPLLHSSRSGLNLFSRIWEDEGWRILQTETWPNPSSNREASTLSPHFRLLRRKGEQFVDETHVATSRYKFVLLVKAKEPFPPVDAGFFRIRFLQNLNREAPNGLGSLGNR